MAWKFRWNYLQNSIYTDLEWFSLLSTNIFKNNYSNSYLLFDLRLCLYNKFMIGQIRYKKISFQITLRVLQGNKTSSSKVRTSIYQNTRNRRQRCINLGFPCSQRRIIAYFNPRSWNYLLVVFRCSGGSMTYYWRWFSGKILRLHFWVGNRCTVISN